MRVAERSPRGRGRALALLRPLPLLVLGFWLVRSPPPARSLSPDRRAAALSTELARLHLDAPASGVFWLDPPAPTLATLLHPARAVVRARHEGEPWDIYLARAHVSPEGSVLRLDGAYDLTRTSAVSEDGLVAANGRAAWVVGDRNHTYRVELADVRGESPLRGEEWTRITRAEHALTNLQHLGQLEGVLRRSFKLDPAASHVELTFEPERLVVTADDHRIGIPFDASRPIEGARFVREEDRTVASPGNLITWAVDRARDLSWFGDERMQVTKAVAYAALDRIDRALGTVRAAELESPIAQDLGEPTAASHSDPDTGFPPEPLPPMVGSPLPDEGKWLALDHDPYVRTSPGVPVPLVTTYLRADRERSESRVIIVEWDPRQVEMDAVAGTEEPQSATGETGNGMIPRNPETMKRVIAAFNGGFQSTHGDFGMQQDGVLLVPPKPYAATIARLRDGSTALGTWPGDLSIPVEVVSFRQNLTPLVGDGKFNPYGRTWWGGVPHDWEDETHTVRSGLCLTREGFVAYFYGTQIDHVHLANAMIAARCDYAVHLDMNQGHTGLELYRVDEASALAPLPGKLDGHWQTEGDVIDMPGYRFRGRRLIRNLQLMHFPRYIRRGARDYFYLMLRPVLPPAPLESLAREPGEGEWVVKGLPQHGFPPALAMTSVRPDPARPETKVRVLAIDPRMVRAAAPGEPAEETVVSMGPPPHAAGDTTLWLTADSAVVADRAPPASVRIAEGFPAAPAATVAAAGIDADGKVVYAEVTTAPDPARDGALLAQVLDAARCSARLFLSAPLTVALGGARDLSGHPVPVGHLGQTTRLLRAPPSGARRLFPETPVLAPQVWMPLQRQTRVFPKEDAPAPSSSVSPEDPPAPPN
jgi:hypothetical protein